MTPHTLRSELVILCERFDLNVLMPRQRKTLTESTFGNRGVAASMDTSNPMKPFYTSSSSLSNRGVGLLPTNNNAPQNKFVNLTNLSTTSPHHNRQSAGFESPPQTVFSNRFSSASFPPRVPSYDLNNAFVNSGHANRSNPLDDFYVEDRYSSFRRDFEKAIDSSYSSFDSSVSTNEFLPLEVVRKIEERAFREGLTRGIQQCAYQVGYQLGLRSSAEKLLNYDDLIGIIGSGASGSAMSTPIGNLSGCSSSSATSSNNNNNHNNNSNINIWEHAKFMSGIGDTLSSATAGSSSSSSTWNVNSGCGLGSGMGIGGVGNGDCSSNINGGNNNCFQIWHNSTTSGFGSNSTNNNINNSTSSTLSQSALWK